MDQESAINVYTIQLIHHWKALEKPFSELFSFFLYSKYSDHNIEKLPLEMHKIFTLK